MSWSNARKKGNSNRAQDVRVMEGTRKRPVDGPHWRALAQVAVMLRGDASGKGAKLSALKPHLRHVETALEPEESDEGVRK